MISLFLIFKKDQESHGPEANECVRVQSRTQISLSKVVY